MKDNTKEFMYLLVIIATVLAIVFGSVFGVQTYQNRDKFKRGDIVETVYENEFKRTVYYDIILEVGKEDYLTMQADGDGNIFDTDNVESKYWLNKRELAKELPLKLRGLK